MAGESPRSDIALRARGLSKFYGKVRALDGVDLEVAHGEIHAVLGENGAGKSTLMGILAGFVKPDKGDAELWGKPLSFGSPSAMRSRGVSLVHQHFMLVPQFTALENLALDELDSLGGVTPFSKVRAKAEEALAKVGWTMDLDAPTLSMPVGVQQRLEILKALLEDSQLIILDEPTAVLSPDEITDLIRVLKNLKAQGRTIILIAHKLSEVYAVADRVTVLRKGLLVGAAALKDLPEAKLAEWMVGEPTGLSLDPPAHAHGEPLLSAKDVWAKGDRGQDSLRGLSMEVAEGEILGIGGVDGNGQLELAEALSGVRPLSKGQISAKDQVAYIPQDRQLDGLALDMPIWENLLIAGRNREDLLKGPFLSMTSIRKWASDLIASYAIKVGSPQDPARSLSGGNQQKVVVARTLSAEPKIVVAMNPTRGLDIKATRFVHDELRRAAARGAGIVLISTDPDELASLSNRILNMSAGAFQQSQPAPGGG